MKVNVGSRIGKDGVTVYFLRWFSPESGKRKCRTVGRDKKKADREAIKLEDQLDDGSYFEHKKITWAEYGKQLLSTMQVGQHRNAVEEAVTKFGEHHTGQLSRVTRPVVRQYLRAVADRGVAVATVNRHHRYINLILNNAVDDGYLKKNPISRMKKLKEPERDIRVISVDEEKDILSKLDEAKGEQWLAYITLMLQTGGRRDETIATSWDDYDLSDEKPMIRYTHTKARKIRRLKLTPETIHLLRKLQVKYGQQPGPFSDWVGHRTTKQWSYFARANNFAVTLHDFRRTCITRWLLAGVALPVVQQMAGHTDIDTTIRYYTAIDTADMERAIDATRSRMIG